MNKSKKLNEKAYVLILVALALGLMLLFLIGFAEKINESKQVAKEINLIEKVNAKYNNIRETYVEMFNELANVSFDFNDSEVLIYDKIPSKQEKDLFKIEVEKFKLFALQEKEDLDVNINNETRNLDLLRIEPYDINYDYALPLQKQPKDYKHIYLSMNSTSALQGINLRIKLLNQGFISTNENFQACASCSNPIDLNITIINPDDSTAYQIQETNIDTEKNNFIKINTTVQGNNDIVINLDNLILEIYNSNGEGYPINTILGIKPKESSENLKILFDNGLFEVGKEKYRKTE